MKFINEINVYLDYLRQIYLKGETFPELLRCDRFLSEKMQHTGDQSDAIEWGMQFQRWEGCSGLF